MNKKPAVINNMKGKWTHPFLLLKKVLALAFRLEGLQTSLSLIFGCFSRLYSIIGALVHKGRERKREKDTRSFDLRPEISISMSSIFFSNTLRALALSCFPSSMVAVACYKRRVEKMGFFCCCCNNNNKN